MPTSQYQVLQQEALDLAAERAAIIAAVPEGAGFTPAQRKTLDRITARQAQLDADLARAQAERAALLAEPEIPGLNPAFAFGPAPSARRAVEPGRRPSARFADLFGSPGRSDFRSFDEFAGMIRSGTADARLMAAASMTTTVGSEGGFLVPDEFAAGLFDGALETEIVRPRATVIPMTSKTKKIPGLDTSDQSAGAIAGLTAAWMEEGGPATDQKAKFWMPELTAHKLAVYAQPSNELVADGTSLETQLEKAMRASISYTLDKAFLVGNGVAKPKGILVDDAVIVVPKETGQPAATIVYENLKKMLARLHPDLFGQAIWIANVSTIPELLSLVEVVGTGGSAVPVLREDGRGGFTLLTRPVVFTSKTPALGTQGDIALAALSEYAVGLRREVTLDRSEAPGWHEDTTSFRAILRVDGRGTWNGVVTPENGSTLSWVVTLATRA